MSFYLFLNDTIRGPYGEGELRDMLTYREVSSQTPARQEGDTEWSTVESCLAAKTPAPATNAVRLGSKSPLPEKFSAPAPEPPAAAPDPVPPVYYSQERRGIRSTYERAGDFARTETSPGLGRLAFVGSCLGVIFFGLLIKMFMEALVGPSPSGDICIFLTTFLVQMALLVMRLQNIGISGWFSLFVFIPFANFCLGGMVLAAPPNYRTTKKLDTAGKIVIGVIAAPFVLFLLCGFIVLALLLAVIVVGAFSH